MAFNAEKETKNIIKFIRSYYKKNNLKGIVVGISGGKDSAVVSALFTKAIGKENVIGVTMPCNSKQSDIEDAKKISDYFGFKLYNVSLSKTFNVFTDDLMVSDFSDKDIYESKINLKPRLRMATLYYVARAFSEKKEGVYLVAGTGNKCEIYVGYFTKGGDGMSDINVLANYTVSEVIKIGEYLNVPKAVLYKTPSDGLSELSDEEKLGISYDDIEKYIDGAILDNDVSLRIKELHERSKHKSGTIVYER